MSRPAACAAILLAAALGAPVRAREGAQPSTPAPQPSVPPAQPGAPAAEPPPIAPLPPVTRDWTVRFEPSAWYVSPGGEVTFPGSTVSDIPVQDLNLDSPRTSFMGELSVERDRYGMLASAVIFDMDRRGAIAETGGVIDGVPFSAGDRLVTSLEFVSVEAAGWYRFYDKPRGPLPDGGFRFRPTWDLLFGGRIYDLGFDIEAPGGAASESGFFAEPYAGVRFSLEIVERFSLDLTADLGFFTDGDDRQSVSWDIIVGFQWNPTNNFGVQIGFRQLAFRLHDGDDPGEFEFNGALAGLYGGLVIRF